MPCSKKPETKSRAAADRHLSRPAVEAFWARISGTMHGLNDDSIGVYNPTEGALVTGDLAN